MQFLIEILRQFVSNWIKLIFLLGLASNLYGQSQQNIIAVYENSYYCLDTMEGQRYVKDTVDCNPLIWKTTTDTGYILAQKYLQKVRNDPSFSFLPKKHVRSRTLLKVLYYTPDTIPRICYERLVFLDDFTYYYASTEDAWYICKGKWRYIPNTHYIRCEPIIKNIPPNEIPYFADILNAFDIRHKDLYFAYPSHIYLAFNLDNIKYRKSTKGFFFAFDLYIHSDVIKVKVHMQNLNLTRRLYKPFKTPKNAPKRIRIRRPPEPYFGDL